MASSRCATIAVVNPRLGRTAAAALATAFVSSVLSITAVGQDESTRPMVFRVPIEGIVDLGMAPFVSRVVAEAEETPGSLILLDINTFGGRVDAAVMIRDVLIDEGITQALDEKIPRGA